jgi:hypothetical protein
MSLPAEYLEIHSVSVIESTIPEHMTIDEWRRFRYAGTEAARRRKRFVRVPWTVRRPLA